MNRTPKRGEFITVFKSGGNTSIPACSIAVGNMIEPFVNKEFHMCIKGYPSSDSGPSKGNFMKRVQIQDDEEAQCQR